MHGPARAARRSSHPVLVFAKTKNLEHNLNAAGNAELIENPKQGILDGNSQAPCDLPIGQAFRHTANYIVSPLGKDRFTRRFDQSHRFRLTQGLDHISELRTICPDLALMNATNALGETFEDSAREKIPWARARSSDLLNDRWHHPVGRALIAHTAGANDSGPCRKHN